MTKLKWLSAIPSSITQNDKVNHAHLLYTGDIVEQNLSLSYLLPQTLRDDLGWLLEHNMWCFARFGTVCPILKNVKNTHGGVLLLVRLQVYHICIWLWWGK